MISFFSVEEIARLRPVRVRETSPQKWENEKRDRNGGNSGSTEEARTREIIGPPVDREKTCPLLLRVFTKMGGHHAKEDFAVRGKELKDEVQIYTWKDATLRELTDLVKEVAPAARRREARLSFTFVYPDKNGRFVVREVGKTISNRNGHWDDAKALAELGFQIGDYLDVAIL